MLIWKNTATLDGFDDGLNFTQSKIEAEIALMGSKPIDIVEFPNLKGIFRAGIGKDNVPEKAAEKKVQSHLILWGTQVPHLQYSFQEPNN